MMAAVCSKQLSNDDVAFVGVGIPLMAGAVASATHAPEVIIVYEGGGVGARSRSVPWTISDTRVGQYLCCRSDNHELRTYISSSGSLDVPYV